MIKHKAPGKAYRDGISLMELAEMFPDEAAALKWFETFRMAERPALRPLWQRRYQGGPEREADAVLVQGLPVLFQRAHRHGN